MAITVPAFIASVPGSQFNSAPEALVSQALTEADAQTSDWAFLSDTQRELAVFYKAAVFLLRMPGAQTMGVADPAARKTWEAELSAIQRAGTIGLRVF